LTEILGGEAKNYYDLIEKNLSMTTEELIDLVLGN